MTTETPSRRTKIVATLGPATDVPGMLQKIISEGVDVVRLNLSHGQPDDHRARANAVREAGRQPVKKPRPEPTGQGIETIRRGHLRVLRSEPVRPDDQPDRPPRRPPYDV